MSDKVNTLDYGGLLSTVLGPMDVFAELLAILPDRFFRLGPDARQSCFRRMLQAYSQGICDLHELARAAGLEVDSGS